MKIELKNIGTVKRAEIDLDKNLLIFCGSNNTGKTYVAYSLYGAYKTQRYNTSDILLNFSEGYNKNEIIFTITPQVVREILKERSGIITDDLGNLFASNQYFFNESEIIVKSGLTDEELISKINDLFIEFNFEPISGSAFKIIKPKNTYEVSIKNVDTFLYKNDVRGFTDQFFTDIMIGFITSIFFGNAYIAPAERIAINIFSKELSLKRSGLLDPFSTDVKSRYSLPITECLRIAEDLQELSRRTSEYSSLAELFEKRILKGSISISQYGAMQFSPADADIKELDIHLSGSMVKSLSSLVFYFRHLAKKGDFIIIDEPELNLHPDNQIIMARILARIVNAGFKVLISTHSDYIIKEFNNLVRLNSKKEEAKEIMHKYGYEKEELLDKDILGVYLFKNNTAISLEVDELGFDVSTIEKVNSELAQISETIYFDLLD
jgi:hypothetical protein